MYALDDVCSVLGGADFQASFGPRRYRVYTCVDFQGDGYTLARISVVSVTIFDSPNAVV